MKTSFKIIAITNPEMRDVAEEAEEISMALTSGAINYIHLRKPQATCGEMEALIQAIPEKYHRRLTLHSWFNLLGKYRLGGIHLNSRHPTLSENVDLSKVRVSKSAHSIAELEQMSAEDCYTYATLSPIYDSISKPGYTSAFLPQNPDLHRSLNSLNLEVIALGGITPKVFEEVSQAGFAGVAILGYLWSPKSTMGERLRLLMESKCAVEEISTADKER
ncbi:MAG: thiamine phosphate synthase [Muribaculum sp.]|nr:thiamine phosphate synthase [Muribaculum sp.]